MTEIQSPAPGLEPTELPLVRYRNRVIHASDLALITQLMQANPGLGRTHLSRLLCSHWNWRQPTGALKEVSFRQSYSRDKSAR